MKLKVLNSDSKANGYVITNGEETLVLEAGCHLKDVKKAIDFNINSVQGLIVSHSHLDHSRYIVEFLSQGIHCLALPHVFDKQGLKGVLCVEAEPRKIYEFGRFKVMPFEVEHDVPCLGYFISHPDMGKLVFITDTYHVPFTFGGVNHIMLEANYKQDILDKNISEGLVKGFVANRLAFSHMDIDETIRILKENDLKKVQTIVLCHLSSSNSDEKLFAEMVAYSTGITACIAKKGLEVDLTCISTP